jgi:hypothetical protein
MKIKPITEQSNEELLKIIEGNARKISTFQYKNDALDFISTFNIQQGEHRILFNLIYSVYKTWSQKPLNKRGFADELVKLFPHIKYGESNVYLVSKPRDFFIEKSLTKKKNKTKTKSWYGHFKRFVDKYQLKSGSFYIKDVVLYNLYDKWVYKNNNKHPLSMNQFLKFCRLFFQKPEVKTIKSHEWFSVNSEVRQFLTPELLELMKK